ncbi:MAG: transcription-repair coupling factor, partial [candidate division Zixibacteria bacterium]|nr:transcription-repair coupling factor [candidate division Zixibacteria bacterium]
MKNLTEQLSDMTSPTETIPQRRSSSRRINPFGDLLTALGKTAPYGRLQSSVETEAAQVVDVTGLAGSLAPTLVAKLWESTQRPTLVVTASPESASRFHDDLSVLIGEVNVARFQSWEILPYEFRTPGPESTGRRLQTLWRVISDHPPVVVTHLRAALEPTIHPDILRERVMSLSVGQDIPLDDLLAKLVRLGYKSQNIVEEVATFSHRGGIVDLFSYSESEPIRIEFFGDTIESIRTFSVSSQRSTSKLDHCVILPSREVDAGGDMYERGWETSDLDDSWRERVESEPDRPGLEWLASVLSQRRARLLDYFGENTIWWFDDPDVMQSEYDKIIGEAERFRDRTRLRLPDPPPVEAIWGEEHTWKRPSARAHRVWMRTFRGSSDTVIDFGATGPPAIMGNVEQLHAEIVRLAADDTDTIIACDNEGQRRRLDELLEHRYTSLRLIYPTVHGGFVLPDAKVALLTEHEIFKRHRTRYRRREFQEGMALSSYTQLRKGDFVVHIDHGVARFRGLESISVEGKRRDCLLLLYQGDDRLFVPIEEFDRVHKFTGKDGKPSISKLGGTAWEKAKKKAKKALVDMAEELIALYAERKSQPGFSFGEGGEWMRQMEDAFVYEETPDQQKAIDLVRTDMTDRAPMDRLICGDVGYGKTEVAVRAAFRAVCDQKQVAVLVPTTILAQQHLTTIRERLSEFPVRIETLSRFRTPKEQKEVVKGLKSGKVDIVIGTHRLLQKDVEFANLGLLVVDEEQRFGVAHKEKLRQLQRRVDTLWLSATPIPRTLQMSLLGARDLSLINTSPRDRLPVITEVREFGPEVVSEAILRELDRKGQVYFVHNRVQTIHAMEDLLKRLLPSVRIAVAHGQMPERELEQVMVRFYHQEYDVLLCTSIIESGLDLPSVNTIIMHRADRFGLAQLYQLRGRVGRSARQAYAYLLTPPFSTLSTVANSRLKAIEEHTALGSGFHLAMRDMEIRGAGNLLGRQQHGFIEEIGFDLYCRMLDEAVSEAKGTASALNERPVPQIEVEGEKFIPDDYVEDNQQRFEMYKRMAEVRDMDSVGDLQL